MQPEDSERGELVVVVTVRRAVLEVQVEPDSAGEVHQHRPAAATHSVLVVRRPVEPNQRRAAIHLHLQRQQLSI